MINLKAIFELNPITIAKLLITLPLIIAIFSGIGSTLNKIKFFYRVWLYIVLTFYIVIIINIWS